jgi:hypothetical protein
LGIGTQVLKSQMVPAAELVSHKHAQTRADSPHMDGRGSLVVGWPVDASLDKSITKVSA